MLSKKYLIMLVRPIWYLGDHQPLKTKPSGLMRLTMDWFGCQIKWPSQRNEIHFGHHGSLPEHHHNRKPLTRIPLDPLGCPSFRACPALFPLSNRQIWELPRRSRGIQDTAVGVYVGSGMVMRCQKHNLFYFLGLFVITFIVGSG